MIKGIGAAGMLAVLLLPAGAYAQTAYCSAPAGYSATHCFGNQCEYTTDALYGGSIRPGLEVSTSGRDCVALASWPYYASTSQPGSVPSDPPSSSRTAAAPPNAAPEISAEDALTGLTLMIGLALVGRGRKLAS